MKYTMFGLMLVLVCTGVSFIASEAKPGDFLYPVKVSINEPLKRLFMVTYEATVDSELALFEERLEEIDALVSTGELSVENALIAKEQLITQYNRTTAALSANGSRELTDAEKAKLASALNRLKGALVTFKDTIAQLDAVLDSPEAEALAMESAKKKSSSRKSSSNVTTTIEDSFSDIVGEDIKLETLSATTTIAIGDDEGIYIEESVEDTDDVVTDEETEVPEEGSIVTEDEAAIEEESAVDDSETGTEAGSSTEETPIAAETEVNS